MPIKNERLIQIYVDGKELVGFVSNITNETIENADKILEKSEINIKDWKYERQYYYERHDFVGMFSMYAPSFTDYMWDHGCSFETDYFKMFKIDDEFYLLHLDSGIMINWYKHLGRTNTCNRPISKSVFIEFLKLLENDIKEEMNTYAY